MCFNLGIPSVSLVNVKQWPQSQTPLSYTTWGGPSVPFHSSNGREENSLCRNANKRLLASLYLWLGYTRLYASIQCLIWTNQNSSWKLRVEPFLLKLGGWHGDQMNGSKERSDDVRKATICPLEKIDSNTLAGYWSVHCLLSVVPSPKQGNEKNVWRMLMWAGVGGRWGWHFISWSEN